MAKGGMIPVMAIIITIVGVALGSVVGLAMVSKTESVFYNMGLGVTANNTMGNISSVIYSSWPLMGLIVLALIGSAVLFSIMIFR